MNITQPTLSHHIKALLDSSIIESRKEGKWMHYSISREGLKKRRDFDDNRGLPDPSAESDEFFPDVIKRIKEQTLKLS